jgi:hypothetical protein
MNFLKENNFQKYSRDFIKNISTMADHKKAKLTENIKNNIKKPRLGSSLYLKTTETGGESPTKRMISIRNVQLELPVITPKHRPNNLLSRYNALKPKTINQTICSKELVKSKDEIVRTIDKRFGVKSPNHKRNKTFDYMKNNDFYYLNK